MRFSTVLSALVALAATTSGFSQTHATSAQEILAGVRLATGGDNWNRFFECESEGEFKAADYTGTYRAVANLRTGENVWRVQIPNAGVNQACLTTLVSRSEISFRMGSSACRVGDKGLDAGAPLCSGTLEEFQVESCEHQDDADID
jgi:hypothetical protein